MEPRNIRVEHGDSLVIIQRLVAEGIVVDAIVTDPPYGLEFMGKEWDGSDGFRRSLNAADAGRDNVFGRTSQRAPEYKTGSNWETGAGFSKPGIGERRTEWPASTGGEYGGANPTCATCGGRVRGKKKCTCAEPDWRVKGVAPNGRYQQMQTFQQWTEAWAREAFAILKPGGHLVVFGGTRTYHRMVCAIEDAGFEIRDTVCWLYGTGFPKSHDVSKGIDAAAGAEREKVRHKPRPETSGTMSGHMDTRPWIEASRERGYHEVDGNTPATEDRLRWQGWGTALKPAFEPICIARKPLVGTVAENVLRHGTGAINVDACRIGMTKDAVPGTPRRATQGSAYGDLSKATGDTSGFDLNIGRWPANVVHDGSDEVLAAFPDSAGQLIDESLSAPSLRTSNVYGKMNREGEASANRRYIEEGATNFAALPGQRRGDSGSAARFFFQAKADASDRLGSRHPTVKPLDLMRWLVTLVTPPGGTVLDPFAGSGSTGIAARSAGFDSILVERDEVYVADIRERIAFFGLRGKRTRVAPSKVHGTLF